MVIDKEFESLLPPLTEGEYKQLKENILKDGCRDPLVVWGEILVDGHNRYKICIENNIHFNTVSKEFSGREEVIESILSTQLGRRNLSDFRRNEIALRYKDVLSKKASERQVAGLKKGKHPPSTSFEVDGEKKRYGGINEELGKIAGTSESSIARTRVILEKGTPEDIKEVQIGKASIYGKAKEIKERDKKDPEVTPKKDGRDLKVVYEGIERSYANYSHTIQNFISDYKTELVGNSDKLKKLLQKEIQELQKIVQDMED